MSKENFKKLTVTANKKRMRSTRSISAAAVVDTCP
jgi:hypothetical protein